MIVRLNGGLGNQMFQYAFGRSVADVGAAKNTSLINTTSTLAPAPTA